MHSWRGEYQKSYFDIYDTSLEIEEDRTRDA